MSKVSYICTLICLCLVGILGGCSHARYAKMEPGIYDHEGREDDFSKYVSDKPKEETIRTMKDVFVSQIGNPTPYATPQQIASAEEEIDDVYRLGAGDVLNLQVWRRPEVSDDNITVSPDGIISVSRVGYLNVDGLTLEEASEKITNSLKTFYTDPEVVLKIKLYNNNKAFVLGRVSNPGIVRFSGKGTLMEALSLSGGLPILATESFLTKCSIVRGKNTILWIDLRELLNNGNAAYNIRIKNDDIIFIPESEDEVVYVMGEVRNPGAVRLKTKLTLLDALMFAGGPLIDADVGRVYIVREEDRKGYVRDVGLRDLLVTANFSNNFILKNHDIIFVGQQDMSKWNYFIQNVTPTVQLISLGTDIAEEFGVMQEVRKNLFGQTGFVNQ